MPDAQSIFDRYLDIRPRLPQVHTAQDTVAIGSLLDIASEVEAFVFDAFGVLNVGERLIPGADIRLNQLRAHGCQIRVLTNAASYDRDGAIAKFKRLGLALADEEIVTSREAALAHLPPCCLGVIAAPGDTLSDVRHPAVVLGDARAEYDAVDAFLFLSSADWSDARHDLLTASITGQPRPLIIANADLAAPREGAFTYEPGYYGHRVADISPGDVRFFGKPFPDVYHIVEKTLPDIARDRVAMCGDTPHTDILGAAAFGWRTVLVTANGLLPGRDATALTQQADLRADWSLPRI